MGLGESKGLNEELELFPIEERILLRDNFLKLSGGNKKTDRQSVEVCVLTYPCNLLSSYFSLFCFRML